MAVEFKGLGRVECSRNLNLLAHAQLEEFDIGSRCGGFGECGGDRLRVLTGAECLSPLTDAEMEHLSEEEIKSGFRLGCQAFPQGDGAEIVLEMSNPDSSSSGSRSSCPLPKSRSGVDSE